MDTTSYLLVVDEIALRPNYCQTPNQEFREIPLSFLLDSFGNLRAIEVEPRTYAQFPFSF